MKLLIGNIRSFLKRTRFKSIDHNQNYKNYSSNISAYDLNLTVKNVDLNKYVNKLMDEYNQHKENNVQRMKLQPVIDTMETRKSIVDNIVDVEELLREKDSEIQKLAEQEKVDFTNKLKEIDHKLLELLLPIYSEDSINSIVLEVQAGVGGQEAMLFAKEIFNMYCNFAEYKGWDLEIGDLANADSGGIRLGTAFIDGVNAFQYFKYEAGVHRVQRIPATEKSGRVHTSTVSVVALPQPRDIDINLEQKDLKIETKRSTGAGGQHVNTTDSAVRIVHIPTGISVESQTDRSQIKNRKHAMAKLRAILYQRELDTQIAANEATRKSQVRSNNRNEKIRTYNFNQDRITDHRLQGHHFHNLKGFMQGAQELEKLIETLNYECRIDDLIDIVNSSK